MPIKDNNLQSNYTVIKLSHNWIYYLHYFTSNIIIKHPVLFISRGSLPLFKKIKYFIKIAQIEGMGYNGRK